MARPATHRNYGTLKSWLRSMGVVDSDIVGKIELPPETALRVSFEFTEAGRVFHILPLDPEADTDPRIGGAA